MISNFKISGWGRNKIFSTNYFIPKNIPEVKKLIKSENLNFTVRGYGKSYGDSSIGENTICTKHLDQIISFNRTSGNIILESGVTLNSLLNYIVPKGWFLQVTPGTKYLSIGGMLASNIHGKNHFYNGSIYNFIDWIEMIDHNGDLVRCSRSSKKELFNWTIGGMGLTGVIVRVSMKLKKINNTFVDVKIIRSKNLSHSIEIMESNKDYEYMVAWVDLIYGVNFGKCILQLANHNRNLKANTNKLNGWVIKNKQNFFFIPELLKPILLNKITMKLYNLIYYVKYKFKVKFTTDLNKFFYPLDGISNWNKFYKNGLIQYQFVISDFSNDIFDFLKKKINEHKVYPYLCVIKKLGNGSGNFDFAKKGYTIALDFPNNKKTKILLKQFDKLVIKFGGRFYLTKDSVLDKKTFEKTEKRMNRYNLYRAKNKINFKFNSFQSKRIGL